MVIDWWYLAGAARRKSQSSILGSKWVTRCWNWNESLDVRFEMSNSIINVKDWNEPRGEKSARTTHLAKSSITPVMWEFQLRRIPIQNSTHLVKLRFCGYKVEPFHLCYSSEDLSFLCSYFIRNCLISPQKIGQNLQTREIK